MISSNNDPSEFDVLNIRDDEPQFTLVGRDKLAPDLVELWAHRAQKRGEDPAKVAEARSIAHAMREFAQEQRLGATADPVVDPDAPDTDLMDREDRLDMEDPPETEDLRAFDQGGPPNVSSPSDPDYNGGV